MPVTASPCEYVVRVTQIGLRRHFSISNRATTALQQLNCDTQQITLANVHAFCIWIGTHQWPTAGVCAAQRVALLSFCAPVGPRSGADRPEVAPGDDTDARNDRI